MALAEHGDHDELDGLGLAHDDLAHVFCKKLRKALRYLHSYILPCVICISLTHENAFAFRFSIIHPRRGFKRTTAQGTNVL